MVQQWAMGNGHYAICNGQWAKWIKVGGEIVQRREEVRRGNGRSSGATVGNGQLAMGNGKLPTANGQKAMRNGQWTKWKKVKGEIA